MPSQHLPRPHLLLHPQREPAPLRSAATVLLLRDSASGIEVLMTRRSMTASFAPGAYVFPGGGIDKADAQCHGLALRRTTQSDAQLTEAIAAIRECYEELGVVLTESAFLGGKLPSYQRSQPFLTQAAALGDKLAANRVFTLARWITDRDLPRRFDVPFLVAPMPPGQTPVADEAEQFEPIWISPAEALRRHDAGDFFIIFPTIRTLQRLQAFATVQAVLDACQSEHPLWTSCPRAGTKNGQDSRHMAHEMEFGELQMVSPDGQICHELAWQSERPVPLLKHVQRLTAPNSGAMTGPGTNTYLIGTVDTGYVVIDAGPAMPAHIDRIVAATGGDVRLIVCTHSHPDHAPGAWLLQKALPNPPPVLGLASLPTARAHSAFSPSFEWDAALTHSLQNSVQRSEWILGHTGDIALKTEFSHTLNSPQTGPITLQVIHTPGHAANHVCLLLQEDGLLFSGDHVLNGSTTVIDPPDGHMGDYLRSLDTLMHWCDAHTVQHIVPAHGYVLGSDELPPEALIAQLKAHRLAREGKVRLAMAQLPQGSAADWVKLAYADTPERLWPVAERSLLAHVAHIRETA